MSLFFCCLIIQIISSCFASDLTICKAIDSPSYHKAGETVNDCTVYIENKEEAADEKIVKGFRGKNI